MLKADFHMHSSEDFYDQHFINYSAKDLIRYLAKKRFEIVSITHHNKVHFTRELKDYAKKKGILLIPGAEPRIEDKDVLLVNVTNQDLAKIKGLDSLEKLKDSALIVAPHPYFFLGQCLGDELERRIKTFHAIEYCHFYTGAMLNPAFKFLNGNEKAIEVAKKHRKALVGTSDGHKLYEFDTTYTMVDCDKNVDSFVEAIKKRRTRLVTRPMSAPLFFRRTLGAVAKDGLLRRIWRLPEARNVYEDKLWRGKQ